MFRPPPVELDKHGNLFLAYLYETEDQVPVALSTDGGLTFHVIDTRVETTAR